MKKSLFVALLAFSFIFPQFVFAQTNSEGQVLSSCVRLTHLLTLGSTDGLTESQVSPLQDFLIEKGLLVTPNGGPTGYYGIRTVAAVKAYQASKGITQTGNVGPLTRAAISTETGCSNVISSSTTANTTASTGGTEPSSSGTPAETGFYFSYVNDKFFASAVTTKADALARCMTTKSNNPNTTILCFWDRQEIYSYPPTQIVTNASTTLGQNTGSNPTPSTTLTGGAGTNQSIVYVWRIYAGPGIVVTATSLGLLEPSLPCNTSNYMMKVSVPRSDTHAAAIAVCIRSNQVLSPDNRPVDVSVATTNTTNPAVTTTATTSSTMRVGVSNSETGPFGGTAKNSGKIYIEFTGLSFSSSPKWCINSKESVACALSSNGYLPFTNLQWKNDSTAVITANGETFASGAAYSAYIIRLGTTAFKIGTFGVLAAEPATSTVAVVGAGPGGIPGNQPITYAWYTWTGPYTLWVWAGNLSFPQPTVACTASNLGATYYLGKGQDNRDVVATCYASNQQMTAAFATVTSTTLNQPSTNQPSAQVPTAGISVSPTTVQVDADFTAYFMTTNSPTSADLKLDDRVIHFDSAPSASWTGTPASLGLAAGSHTLSFRACNASGCSAYSAPVSITVTNSPPATTTQPPTNSCTWTTGVASTFNWACGSTACTGAPAGTGWVPQESGCYHQPISGTSNTSTGGSGGSVGGGGGEY